MSYLILEKKGTPWPTLPETPLYRVVSGALDGASGKRFTLCGTDGRKKLQLTEQEFPKEARALSYLKRGELLYIKNELRRGDDLLLGKGPRQKLLPRSGNLSLYLKRSTINGKRNFPYRSISDGKGPRFLGWKGKVFIEVFKFSPKKSFSRATKTCLQAPRMEIEWEC